MRTSQDSISFLRSHGFVFQKPPSQYTQTYLNRIAGSYERQAKAGKVPTRRAARGHLTAPEHPKASFDDKQDRVYVGSKERKGYLPAGAIKAFARTLLRRFPKSAYFQLVVLGRFPLDFWASSIPVDPELKFFSTTVHRDDVRAMKGEGLSSDNYDEVLLEIFGVDRFKMAIGWGIAR